MLADTKKDDLNTLDHPEVTHSNDHISLYVGKKIKNVVRNEFRNPLVFPCLEENPTLLQMHTLLR